MRETTSSDAWRPAAVPAWRERYDSGGLEELTQDECRELLASVPIGRIVFTDQALPTAQPVNFTMADGDVIIRTAAGSKLAVATRDVVVAFEVDSIDTESRNGWSVVAVGEAHAVTDPDELAELRRLPLRPWAPGRRESFIRIHPELISGRRIIQA